MVLDNTNDTWRFKISTLVGNVHVFIALVMLTYIPLFVPFRIARFLK